ncbi:LOW QUALITY PROTEIN: hypothetical protein V2J09_015870, partial [Rumex salicifolius]
SPTTANQNLTPQERWSGTCPSIKHFKVFGCTICAHVPDQQRKKLNKKSSKCFFLGISLESKAYRLYHPTTRMVVVSSDDMHGKNHLFQRLHLLYKSPLQTMGEQNSDPDPEGIEEENEQNSEPVEELGPRQRRPPRYLDNYVVGCCEEECMLTATEDPQIFEEVAGEQRWVGAMKQEICVIERNDTWFLTELLRGAQKIGVKWVYKTKLNENGEVDKYKARLVVKGYAQKQGRS